MTLGLLVQVATIVVAGWIAAAIARRCGLSAAVGQMLMGLALGPSLLGWLAPEVFAALFGSGPAEPLAWLARAGLLLLMFQVGLEFDVSHLAHARARRTVAVVGTAALVVPFSIGLVFGHLTAPILSPGIDPYASTFFVATAFSITALPILARILGELDLHRTELGVIAISAAACIDLAGWVLLAFVSTFAASPAGAVAVLGAFGAGVLLHRRAGLVAAWHRRMAPLVSALFVPLYLAYTGLRTDVGSLEGAGAWGWCAAVIAVATLGKFGAAYAAARWVGLSHAQSAALGAMMNTRGLVELVVLNIGLDLGILSPVLFSMMVIMAFATTFATSPLLSLVVRPRRTS